MDLSQALLSLDFADDDQWTADGLPRVDVVSSLTGSEVTRKQITDFAPEFTRSTASKSAETPAEEPETKVEPAREAPEDRPELGPEFVPDDADVGVVELRDDVLAMPLEDVVAGGHELVDRALAEFSRQHKILLRRREQVNKALSEVSKRSEHVERIKNRLPAKDDKSSGLPAYLEQQRKNREARAQSARRFAEAGTNAQDVVSVLDPRAKIDVAMQRRGAQRGETRPARPVNRGAAPKE